MPFGPENLITPILIALINVEAGINVNSGKNVRREACPITVSE